MGLDMYLGSFKGRNDLGNPLTLEQVKAYNTLYHEIYCDDVALDRDARVAETKRLKQEFLELNKITSLAFERGTPGIHTWTSLEKEEIYWRKANAIHQWFVNNVQYGNDDCGMYVVEKDALADLVGRCKDIMDKCQLVEGMVKNGSSSKPNQYCIDNDIKPEMGMYPNWEKGKVMTNSDVADNLLPTQSGFFFGNRGYNEWYMQDIEHTYTEGMRLLNEFNFEDNFLVYSSSW